MIFILIGLLINIAGIINFKTGFYLFLFYKIILVPNICLISVPGLPFFTMELFLSIVYFGLYLLKGKRYRKSKYEYPFKKPAILLSISWILSSVFSIAGFRAEITRSITLIFSEIVVIYIVWNVVESEEDFNRLLKGFTVVIFLTCIYAVLEYILRYNPIYQYEISLVKDADRAINNNIYINSVRGYRVQSFFNHAIGAGMNWALYVIWILTSIVILNKRIPYKNLSIITVVICIPCIILSNSRAPIVFLVIGCSGLMDFRKRKSWNFFLIGIVAIMAMSPLLLKHSTNFTSIFSSSVQEKIGGSTVAMRFDQLDACIEILNRSPIFGMGAKFLDYIESNLLYRLKGLESVWFMAMTQYGIIGIIAYFYRASFEIFCLPKYFKSKEAFLLALAYWVTYSLTSVPGFLTYMYYIVMFYYIKNTMKYNESVMLRGYKKIFGAGFKLAT